MIFLRSIIVPPAVFEGLSGALAETPRTIWSWGELRDCGIYMCDDWTNWKSYM